MFDFTNACIAVGHATDGELARHSGDRTSRDHSFDWDQCSQPGSYFHSLLRIGIVCFSCWISNMWTWYSLLCLTLQVERPKVTPTMQHAKRSSKRATMKKGRKAKKGGKAKKCKAKKDSKAKKGNAKTGKNKNGKCAKKSKNTDTMIDKPAKGRRRSSKSGESKETKLKRKNKTERKPKDAKNPTNKKTPAQTDEPSGHSKVFQDRVDLGKGKWRYEVLENQVFGCSNCRFIFNGCKMCRNPISGAVQQVMWGLRKGTHLMSPGQRTFLFQMISHPSFPKENAARNKKTTDNSPASKSNQWTFWWTHPGISN